MEELYKKLEAAYAKDAKHEQKLRTMLKVAFLLIIALNAIFLIIGIVEMIG